MIGPLPTDSWVSVEYTRTERQYPTVNSVQPHSFNDSAAHSDCPPNPSCGVVTEGGYHLSWAVHWIDASRSLDASDHERDSDEDKTDTECTLQLCKPMI